jgi:riboflavin synthase
MFTGIIERLGRLAAVQPAAGGARLVVEPERAIDSPIEGESIAVSGACLTLEAGSTPARLNFFLSTETLARTTFGASRPAALVNLERALKLGDRLGGHLVHGHVDAVGAIRRWERRGEAWWLEVEHPPELSALLAPKGSIAVDGISLTIVQIADRSFTVAVIPRSVETTSLREARVGGRVNLEADMLARYVLRALESLQSTPRSLTRDTLREAGF